MTDNEVDTYINPDTQKAEESVSPAFSVDDIKLIVNNISRISDNLNENYNGEYQEYTLANYAFSHSGAEYDLNLSVHDNVSNMLANGEYGFLTEYLQTIYKEAFEGRILLDEGVIAENTLPLIEEQTKKSERSLNIPDDLDKFYINKESESVTWVYFNPDSSVGGQLVYNNITFDQLFAALESDNITETLTHTARTVLVDVDNPVFQSRAKYFLADNEDFSFNGDWDKEKLSAIVEPTYSIYQLKSGDDLRDYRFADVSELRNRGLTVDRDNYNKVYSGRLGDDETLDDLYTKFNVNRPEDFYGHSMSVGDVIEIRQNGKQTAHYVDGAGFEEIPDFSLEKATRAVEIFKAKTAEKFSPVDGQTAHNIEDTVRDFVQGVLNDGGIDAEIVDLAVTGSRSRGLESDGSDIDVVIEFSSELKEDALFNILHEQTFDVGGIAIDINPIRKEETGTLGEYLEKAEKTIAENHERKTAAVPSADNIDRISEIISEVRHGKTAQIIENAEKDVIIEDARKRKFSNIRLGYNDDSGFNLTADTDSQKDVIITVFGRNEQAVRDYLTKNAKEIDIVEEKSTIHFGYLGNGLTVYDVSKWDNEIKDYPTIAHITNEGTVNYRAEKSTIALSDIARIEAQALQLKQEFTESWNKLSYEQRLQRVLDGADALAKPDWDVFFADKTALTGEEIVKKYEHAIIFKDEQFPTAEKSLTAYRVGDFYELFNEDAHVAVDLLNLTQTKRNGVPMVGFPIHVYEDYRRKFAMNGYYLQIGDEREIDKILYPKAAPDKSSAKSPDELRVGDLVRGDGAIWRITEINGDFSIYFENTDKTANNSVQSFVGHWKENFAKRGYEFVSPTELTAEQLREINVPSVKPKPKKSQAETVQQDSEQLSLFDEPTVEADTIEKTYIGGIDIEEAFKRELIQHGTGFVDGKFGVEEFYLEHKSDTKAFAKYLSDAYGIGGRSGEGKILSVDHNLFGVKGISMRIALDNGEETRVSWNWNKVAKRIARLIEDGEYISQDEIDKRIKRYQREYSLGAESPYYEKAKNVLDHYGLLPEQTKTETLTVTDAQELEKGDKIRYEGKEWTVGMVGDYLISLNSSSGEHKNIYNALEKKWYDELNERGFEFITAADEPVISENTAAELNRAKELINDFCENEYDGEGADFSDLSRVAIAYTDDEETGLPINVYADLVRNRLITQFNNVTVRVDEYTSLAEMNEVALPELNFDELILDAITYKQPTITCNFSESSVFTADKTYTVAEFDEIMKQADDRRVAGKKAAIKFYGSERAWSEAERKRISSSDQFAEYLGYDKTSFTVNMPSGSSFTERQDIGDGYGGVIDFLSKFDKYKDIVPLLEKARYEQNADRVAELNGNYNWETFSEKDYNELTSAIKAHDTENRKDVYSISPQTSNAAAFQLEVGVATSNKEWALSYDLYDKEDGDIIQVGHYDENEIPDYFSFVKSVESSVQKKITETIDARAAEIGRPTKQERTEDNFSVIQEFTFDNEKSRAATKDFALSTGATVSEIPEKALKSGLYGIKVETWESRADEIKDFAAGQNAVNTLEWGVHQVVTVNDMSGADYKYDYRFLAEAIEAADGYESGTRQEMYGEFVKYDGAVVYNKDNLKIEHIVGEFDVRSIFSEEVLKANGIDIPEKKAKTAVEENQQTAEISNPLVKELEKTFPADTAEHLYNAFEGAKMADWQSNNAKINRVKRALYDILGNEEQTESAFAVLANGGTSQQSTDNILDKLDVVKDSDGYADLKADVEILLRDKNGDSLVGVKSDVWLKKLNEMSADELREYANHYEKGQLGAYGSLNSAEKSSKITQTATPKTDFTITDEHLGEGGAKSKFAANIAAIQTLKQIESENRFATPEEQETLSKYVGWGGLPQAFDGANAKWSSEYEQLKNLLTDDEYRAANASVLNAHYTSPTVIQAIYKGLQNLGFEGGNILEPAMGIGNFFGAMPDDMRQNSKLSGVELDSISGRIAKQLYPTADIQVKGFEETNFSDNLFDVAVGNVPFGSVPISDKRYNRENFYIHDYFLAKSLDKIAPNGIMAMITTKGTLDKTSPKVREYLARRADLIGAIRLPNNAFKANAGTEVTTDILFFQKREEMAVELPDWCYIGKTPDGVPVNNYFVDHPEMMLGEMKQGLEYSLYGNAEETACVPIEGANLAEQLEKAVTNLKVNRALQIHNEERAKREGVIPATADVRNFTFAEVDGLMYYRENNIMTAVVDKDNKPISGKKLERLKALNELRKTFRTILTAQENDCSDVQLREYQKILNNQYDVFVKKYGYINDSANLQVFGKDDDYNCATRS